MRRVLGLAALIALVVGSLVFVLSRLEPRIDKAGHTRSEMNARAAAIKAAVVKVMNDAVAAHHGGVLPKALSAEDFDIAAKAALEWKRKQPRENDNSAPGR